MQCDNFFPQKGKLLFHRPGDAIPGLVGVIGKRSPHHCEMNVFAVIRVLFPSVLEVKFTAAKHDRIVLSVHNAFVGLLDNGNEEVESEEHIHEYAQC